MPTTVRGGVIEFDSLPTLRDDLFTIQRGWCERYGIADYCVTCRYPMAATQTRCLICTARQLIIDEDANRSD
jgi:hypothetical protein